MASNVNPQTRLLLQERSGLGLHCLLMKEQSGLGLHCLLMKEQSGLGLHCLRVRLAHHETGLSPPVKYFY